MKQSPLSETHAGTLKSEKRFAFGENWAHFLHVIDEERIKAAQCSLTAMLTRETLSGLRFLDIGSGSGLFSLAARRLGATVSSFDFDPQAVAATKALQRRYFPEDRSWTIEQGSVLDQEYLASLGQFDLVYAWGVLHHTGSMWQALDNVIPLISRNGKLFLSIYNDQHWKSRYWTTVKIWYNHNTFCRLLVTTAHLWLLMGRIGRRALNGQLRLRRGMSLWYDYLDWLGGYPFEVAAPEAITDFYRKRGFILLSLHACGKKSGCNEYLFQKQI